MDERDPNSPPSSSFFENTLGTLGCLIMVGPIAALVWAVMPRKSEEEARFQAHAQAEAMRAAAEAAHGRR